MLKNVNHDNHCCADSTHFNLNGLLQVTLNDAIVEDVSWDLKRANAIRITSAIGFKIVLVCESPQEHKQVIPRSAAPAVAAASLAAHTHTQPPSFGGIFNRQAGRQAGRQHIGSHTIRK